MDTQIETPSSRSEDRLVYTVAEAGELLGISRAFAYELVALGELPVIRLGRRPPRPQGRPARYSRAGPLRRSDSGLDMRLACWSDAVHFDGCGCPQRCPHKCPHPWS